MKLSKISVWKEKPSLFYLFTYLYVHTCICMYKACICVFMHCLCLCVPMGEEVRQPRVSALFFDTEPLSVLSLVS